MKSQSLNVVRTSVALLALTALTACGASTKPRSDGVSSNGGSGGGTTSSSGSAVTECNVFDSGTTNRVSGKATTYYFNGALQQDKLRLRLTGIPAIFDSSSTAQIKFFRWSADGSGTSNLDSTPLSFVIEKGTSSTQTISSAMTKIDKADVATLRSSGGVSGSTSQDFFANTVFTISGVDYAWDVLKVVVYDGASTTASVDFLLPAFYANPNKYDDTHPAILNALHPFWNMRGDTVTETEWKSRAQALCF
jgi:hypothetical protein